MSHERRLYNLEQLEAIDGMAFSQKHYPELGGWQNPKTLVIHASVVGSKAANGGQVKTGQRMWPGTWFFYPIFS